MRLKPLCAFLILKISSATTLDPFEKKVGDKAQEKTIRATMKQHGGQYINILNIPA